MEEVKGLIARGLHVGVLTYAEIATATAELDLDETDVEELRGFLERAEIELVEELDPALASAEVERAPDKRGRRKPKTALDLKPDMTTDSLQLFLKDIGKVRLLTAQKPVGDEEESEFGQFIADEQAESPYERAVQLLTKEALREALENLSYRERRVARPNRIQEHQENPHSGTLQMLILSLAAGWGPRGSDGGLLPAVSSTVSRSTRGRDERRRA